MFVARGIIYGDTTASTGDSTWDGYEFDVVEYDDPSDDMDAAAEPVPTIWPAMNDSVAANEYRRKRLLRQRVSPVRRAWRVMRQRARPPPGTGRRIFCSHSARRCVAAGH